MAASTRSRTSALLFVAGLALLQGCGSCVEDPNAKEKAEPGSVGPSSRRFPPKTEIYEDAHGRPGPAFLIDAQAP
jgi:hypothetical protein